MAISFVGSATGVDTATMPAHQAGDYIIVSAYKSNGSSLIIEPSGYTRVNRHGNGLSPAFSRCLAYKVAVSGSELVGTFAGATSVVVSVYRGLIGVGAWINNDSQSTSSANYPAIALQSSSSWVFAAGGVSSVSSNIDTPPAGVVSRGGGIIGSEEHCTFDTDGVVATWTSKSVSLGAAYRWGTYVLELKGPAAITINAACSSATTASKAIAKLTSVAATATVAATKRITKPVATTVASTVSAFKRAGKLIASTVSSAVSTSSKSLATVIINASVSAGVTTRRAVGKAVAVSASAATSIVKRANKAVSAAASGVVSATKRAGKTVSVIQNMFVTITRQRAVEISAAVSSAVTVSRGMFVRISAAVSSAVNVTFESVVSWLPLNVYRSGMWIVGKLRTYRSGSWVRPKLKRYVGGVWIDVE